MPFCPNCHYEYEANVSRCSDCDELLVAELPPDIVDDPGRDIDWVPLATLTSQQYSEMLLEALRAREIDAIEFSGTGHFGKLGMMGPTSFIGIEGTYVVAVPREQLQDADGEGSALFGDDWAKMRSDRTE